MSMMLMVKAMQIKVGNPLRKLVLLKLADNASDFGECWPSHQHIADQCEISKRSVIEHIKALVEMNLLRVENRVKNNEKQSNVYYLTLDKKSSAGNSLPSATDAQGGAGNSLPSSAGDAHRTSHSSEPVNESKQSSIDDDKSSSQQTDNQEKSENPEMQQHQKKPTNGYSEAFEAWWSIYPKKVGKGDAWKSWKRDKLDKKADQLIEKLEAQNAMQYSFTEYKFVPLPATYLNQSRYDDEVQLVTNGGRNATNQPNHTDNSLVGRARAKAEASYQAMLDEEARSNR